MKKIFFLVIANIILTLNIYALNGKIITTIDYSIQDKWYNTAGDSIPRINNQSNFFTEQYFIIALFFSNFSLKDKQAHIIYDISVTKNNKNIYNYKNLTGIKSTVNNKNYVLLSKTNLMVNFEKNKPRGKYVITVKVKDLISKKSLLLSKSIYIQDYKHANYFKSKNKLSNWIATYYRNPTPSKAIDGYLYFAKSKKKNSSFIPVFTFFLNVFNKNKYLIPTIHAIYNKQDKKTKVYLIYLLNYLNYDSKKFLNNLNGKEKNLYNKIRNQPYAPNPYKKIYKSFQLDMLWGEFFATGSYKPIKKIISILDYSKNELVYKSASWSLKSNYKQHLLVRNYCIYTLKYMKISNDIKKRLKKIINE